MVKVYSKEEFYVAFKEIRDYVESLDSNAFISITGNIENERHLFSGTTPNVLNLRFDDIDADELDVPIVGEGCYLNAKGISREQARDIVDFVLLNKDKNFHVHCHAGVSRSGAVGEFIVDLLNLDYAEFRRMNPKLHPNPRVRSLLKEEARNRGLL